MGLYEQLKNDMTGALRAGDQKKLSVIRMVISAVKMLEIEKTAKEIQEADILQILQKQVKQHKESIAQFEKGARPDLVAKEAEELKILVSYLPEQLSEAEVQKIVQAAIVETGAVLKSDTGKVMKVVMAKVAGKTDGKTVNRILAQFLK